MKHYPVQGLQKIKLPSGETFTLVFRVSTLPGETTPRILDIKAPPSYLKTKKIDTWIGLPWCAKILAQLIEATKETNPPWAA